MLMKINFAMHRNDTQLIAKKLYIHSSTIFSFGHIYFELMQNVDYE